MTTSLAWTPTTSETCKTRSRKGQKQKVRPTPVVNRVPFSMLTIPNQSIYLESSGTESLCEPISSDMRTCLLTT